MPEVDVEGGRPELYVREPDDRCAKQVGLQCGYPAHEHPMNVSGYHHEFVPGRMKYRRLTDDEVGEMFDERSGNPAPRVPEREQLLEALREHAAEWRGDPDAGRVRWVCVAGDWSGDDYEDWRTHLADQVCPPGQV